VVDRVVGHKDVTRHHARDHGFITTPIDFLLGIEKAKSEVLAARQVSEGITVDKLDDIADPGCGERLPCQRSFLIQYLVGYNLSAGRPAGQGKPERGVACAGSN